MKKEIFFAALILFAFYLTYQAVLTDSLEGGLITTTVYGNSSDPFKMELWVILPNGLQNKVAECYSPKADFSCSTLYHICPQDGTYKGQAKTFENSVPVANSAVKNIFTCRSYEDGAGSPLIAIKKELDGKFLGDYEVVNKDTGETVGEYGEKSTAVTAAKIYKSQTGNEYAVVSPGGVTVYDTSTDPTTDPTDPTPPGGSPLISPLIKEATLEGEVAPPGDGGTTSGTTGGGGSGSPLFTKSIIPV